ncbi:hypothetical protein WMF20_12985 [Sorangium sp. So ce834]|uniref:hypothetical protein n=1 Tax=Sorangium sp. So ce834 TaxID=3133321 RepID=UPI003F5F63DF
MRSFYVFTQAPDEALSTWLDSTAQRTAGTWQWIYPNAARKVLYIELAEDLYDELEPETAQALLDRFGGERPRSICIDVSRNHSAEHDVKAFATAMLRQFGGVAMDDESDHCWTAEAIEAGDTHHGHRFFGMPGAA